MPGVVNSNIVLEVYVAGNSVKFRSSSALSKWRDYDCCGDIRDRPGR